MPTGARLARTDDVDAISRITVIVWRERLSPILGAGDLDFLDESAFAKVWGDSVLHPPSPLHRVAVAVDEPGFVRGYAAWGPASDADSDLGDVEVIAFDIDPQHRRAGHGSRLISAVAGMSAEQGARALSMWCTAGDEPRRAFLASCGWAPDAAWRDIEVAPGTLVREVRLVTGLDESDQG